MLLRLFFTIIYVTLHLFTNVWMWCNHLVEDLIESFKCFLQGHISSEDCLKFIGLESKVLDKLPRHITIILGNDKLSFNDLANFVIWSLTAGVSFISFYDHKGNLKKSQADLIEAVEEIRPENYHVVWHNQSLLKNGFVGRKIHVKILSLEDGQETIARITKELAMETNEINAELLQKRLENAYEFPNPDLAICCGRFLTLYGYPPWQIQTTEFTNIPTHRKFDVLTFLNLLKVYSKCEQRFGK